MIYAQDNIFILNTEKTSYAFLVNKEGLLEHLHYGGLIPFPTGKEDEMIRAMSEKISHNKGTSINYKKDSLYFTEDMLLEVSGLGKGDFREPFVEAVYPDGSRTNDFVFESAEVLKEIEYPIGLPSAIETEEYKALQLKVVLKEQNKPAKLEIYYTVYPECDVITRRTVFRNTGDESIRLVKLMSTQVDFDSVDYKVTSFGGNWGREMKRTDTNLSQGSLTISSRCGISSNRSNPFVMLTNNNACETAGEGYGFNLVYSGNHYESFEVSGYFKTRFVSGINPEGFEWIVEQGQAFETPEAVMTYSEGGYRGISLNMQHFVREHIVRGKYKYGPRPILLNSWEAAYFNINEARLLDLAKKGKEAGIELFVMDDGWFKGRNDDTSSLGDWTVDKKKLPKGVEHLAAKVHELGLDFGIWVEPEMVNENSDLFREHPEYAMAIPGRDNSPGRNQMILDLTNCKVTEYIVKSMHEVFSIPGINYVKWDMNRMFADVFSKVLPAEKQGETAHRYCLGLYSIMDTLTKEFPDILFEGCSSGGNRTDLGILCYMPQIWGSDDTDAIERTHIQTGYSYGYPLSCISAHVSACPNHQTLRNTPIDTRFNVAAFGVLGYEINLCECKDSEFEEIKKQIATYKEWRDIFFGGDFYRVSDNQWMVVSKDKRYGVSVVWKELCKPNDFYLKLKTVGLDPEKTYHAYNVQLKHNLKLFGDLVNQVAPIHIKKDSLIHNTLARFVKMDGEVEDYMLKGSVLNNAGIKLTQAFGGTGYNGETRLFQDFYSRMYFFEAE